MIQFAFANLFSPRRRPASLRETIMGVAIAAAAYVGVIGIIAGIRLVPAARSVQAQSRVLSEEFTARTDRVQQLDFDLRQLWSMYSLSLRGQVDPDSLTSLRMRMQRVEPSRLLAQLQWHGAVQSDVASLLGIADNAEQELRLNMLAVLAAFELGDSRNAGEYLRQSYNSLPKLQLAVRDVNAYAIEQANRRTADLAERATSTLLLVVGWFIVGVIVLPMFAVFLRKRFYSPLLALDRGFSRLAANDLDVELPIRHEDEIGRLTGHFNQMTALLRQRRADDARHAELMAQRAVDARYRAAFEQAAVGMAEVGLDGRFLRVNDALANILGRASDDLVGRDFKEFVVRMESPRTSEQLHELRNGEMPLLHSEFRCHRGDGEIVSLTTSTATVRDEHGTPRYAVVVVQDVTEQRRLAADLQQAQKMEAIGQLAGGIAHDFNNLLTGIIGYADLLQQSGDASVREDAAVIRTTALRGADLSRSLLALARRAPQHRQPVDMHEVLREVTDLVRRTFDRRISVQLECATQQFTVDGDRSFLSNALLNLAINARDAMPDGGHLVFRAYTLRVTAKGSAVAPELAPGAYLVVEVRDSGVGMDEKIRRRIFEPFFSTKETGKGTGLGLSMVYGTVRAHDGAVTVESTPGTGTSFRLYLPLSRHPVASLAAAKPNVEIGAGRVLLVDDDPLVRTIAERMLQRLGYEVDAASDGRTAIDLANQGTPYDAAVIDYNMPGMTGAELAQQLQLAGHTFPRILASGYIDGDETAMLDHGFAGVVHKPYTLDELGRVVALHARGGTNASIAVAVT